MQIQQEDKEKEKEIEKSHIQYDRKCENLTEEVILKKMNDKLEHRIRIRVLKYYL